MVYFRGIISLDKTLVVIGPHTEHQLAESNDSSHF
mgnify:CR=1 FL=1